MKMYQTEVKQPTDTMTMEQVAYLSLRHLTNTEESPFLYKGHRNFYSKANIDKPDPRFDHTKARNGSRFTDGNNGDYWRVIVAMPQYNRMLVQNLSQDFVTIMYWDKEQS